MEGSTFTVFDKRKYEAMNKRLANPHLAPSYFNKPNPDFAHCVETINETGQLRLRGFHALNEVQTSISELNKRVKEYNTNSSSKKLDLINPDKPVVVEFSYFQEKSNAKNMFD